MTVLVAHDPGCRWARFEGEVSARGEIIRGGIMPGHTDAAKRLADAYNLHRAAGETSGWIAVRYQDGSSDGTVYDSRAAAVADRWPREGEFFYATLAHPSMTVCAAESVLRWKRVMAEMDRPHASRDAPAGGLEVIPRLAAEDQEAQIRAVRSGHGTIAMGYRRSTR